MILHKYVYTGIGVKRPKREVDPSFSAEILGEL
jgi:hypothetical protein